MNYDQHLTELIEAIKADSIPQPQKNWITSEAGRLQILIRGAKTFTNRKEPVGECTCPEGGLRMDCPVHGDTMA